MVHDRAGRLQLGIEVRTALDTTVEYITEWKQNIFSHEEPLDLPFWMMAFPDRFYLWKNPHQFPESEPDYVIDARPLLQDYFSSTGIRVEKINIGAFELMISSWLSQIIHFGHELEDLPSALRESGLLDAIADGAFSFEAVA